LYKEDVRINITLARIQFKRGNLEKARETLAAVKARQGELTKFDLDVMRQLSLEISKPRTK
jgi:ATP/maltotriose-dependent transcriptional regulator MalT